MFFLGMMLILLLIGNLFLVFCAMVLSRSMDKHTDDVLAATHSERREEMISDKR